MLGDALVYGFSLFVLARSVRWQAGTAFAKGAFMLLFGRGGGSYVLASRWPDLIVGAIIAGLFLASSLSVLRESIRELRGLPSASIRLVER